MSLNGLDGPAVLEAYQSALMEAGGWFLLHYVSRDEVALLSRGTGGVPDMRNAIDGYEELSPLYGFLQYRRRKVVLSYLPEDLSRLVKARTTVQFQSVQEKFSPHDTVFPISKSTDLTESALSSACLLHAASGSITSSSSSLRRRRLMEITEDAEENAPDKDETLSQPSASESAHRPYSRQSEATVVAAAPRAPSRLQQTTTSDQLQSPAEPSAPDASSTPSVTLDHVERTPSLKNPRDDLPSDPRRLSTSSRLSLRELDYTSPYTPKVKRGPRPSVDSVGRPRTADQRPVASLPAGVRSSSLRRPSPNNASRPRSQGNNVASSISGRSATPAVPSLLVPAPLSMPISRPHVSSGAKSLSAVSSSGMSPEKERLMKALQQRKEKRAGQDKQNSKATVKETDEKETVGNEQVQNDKEAAHRPVTVNDNSKQSPEPLAAESQSLSTVHSRNEARSLSSPDQSKPDSAVDLVASDYSDSDQPFPTTPTTATTTTAITLSMGHNNDEDINSLHGFKDNEDLQEPQTLAAETQEQQTSAASGAEDDSECHGGPRSSSAAQGPLENKSRNAPENNEIVVSPPPTEQPHNPAAGEVDAAAEAPETSPRPETPSIANSPSISIVSNDPDSQNDSSAPESSDAVRQDVTERKEKRKPYVEPIQVPTPEYSDDDNLSDDSFMEELKSATVQEAKPVSVGPISPAYTNNGSEQILSSRAVSNPSASGDPELSNMDATSGGRSVSSTYPAAGGPMSPVMVARKVNVSSGISKRIKALEKFTGGREVPATLTPPNLAGSSSSTSFEAFQKRASISKATGNPNTPPSRKSSYTVDPPSRRASLSPDDPQSSKNAPRTSASVTARIVRDSDDVSPNNSDATSLNLQAKPLTVEHEALQAPPSPHLTAESATDNRETRRASTSSAGPGNQSLAATIPCSESRLSNSSQMEGQGDEKRASRSSRIFDQMPSITSNSRKSLLGTSSPSSPTTKEENAVAPPEMEKGPLPTPEGSKPIEIGEVNVQFPDTLLWKRRYVRVDKTGYLVLAPANVDSTGRNMIKRYHLAEFRVPGVPDEDCQELPNSIVLDFLDGSTLQCACESRQGQDVVLKTLTHAWNAYQPA